MAIHESKKQSDLEKRLKLLRQQVYGKENRQSSSPSGAHSYQLSDKKKIKSDDRYRPQVGRLTTDSYSDTTYLYHDLFKILTLSSLAIGVQLILFMLLKNHILNLNFF